MRLKNVSDVAVTRAMEQVEEAWKALFDAQAAYLSSSAPDAGDWHAEFAVQSMERAIQHLKGD